MIDNRIIRCTRECFSLRVDHLKVLNSLIKDSLISSRRHFARETCFHAWMLLAVSSKSGVDFSKLVIARHGR